MTLFIVGFILGIFVGAFVASKPFRDKVIKAINDYRKQAKKEAKAK